jgi:preprotein translocase subunit SecG
VFAFFVVVHILICVALILVVLLQAGKGGGLAGAFGGSAATTLFGGRGAATFLAKATSGLAIGFMAMSILLAILSSRGQSVGGEGLLQQRARERAAQSQLPPSTSTFDPQQTTDSLFPAAPADGATPPGSVPAPATPQPAGAAPP